MALCDEAGFTVVAVGSWWRCGDGRDDASSSSSAEVSLSESVGLSQRLLLRASTL